MKNHWLKKKATRWIVRIPNCRGCRAIHRSWRLVPGRLENPELCARKWVEESGFSEDEVEIFPYYNCEQEYFDDLYLAQHADHCDIRLVNKSEISVN
jgi:hypothetical protein